MMEQIIMDWLRTISSKISTLLVIIFLGSTLPVFAGPIRTVANGGVTSYIEDIAGPFYEDDGVRQVDLGFTIKFFGTSSVSQLYLNSNGSLSISDEAAYYVTDDLRNLGMLAGLFMDWKTSDNPIRYGKGIVDGKPAFLADWIGVTLYNSASTCSMQMVLISTGNLGVDYAIEYNYDTIPFVNRTAFVGFLSGTSGGGDWIMPGSSSRFPDNGGTPLIRTRSLGQTVFGRIAMQSRNGVISTPSMEFSETIGAGNSAQTLDLTGYSSVGLVVDSGEYFIQKGDSFSLFSGFDGRLFSLTLPTNVSVGVAWDFSTFYSQGTLRTTDTPDHLGTISPLVWLDAGESDSLIASSGQSILQWIDKSGRGNHATQTLEVAQPSYGADALNGYGAVVFSGAQYLNFPVQFFSGSQGRTLIFVANTATNGLSTPLFSNCDQSAGQHFDLWSDRLYYSSSDSVTFSNPLSSARFEVMAVVLDAGASFGSAQIFSKGFWSTTPSSAIHSLNTAVSGFSRLGRSSGLVPSYFNGKMVECLLYDRKLSSAELDRIFRYYRDKYKLNLTQTNTQFQLF